MSQKTSFIQDILSTNYPEWKEKAPLPGDLLCMCVDYLIREINNGTTNGTTQGRMVNGKQHGEWIFWYDAEKTLVYVTKTYHYGKLHGERLEYFDNGQIKIKEVYVHGRREGEYTEWYRNGQVHSTVNYVNNKMHGERKEYFENGQISYLETYKYGMKHGRWNSWYEDGEIASEYMYNHGKLL